MAAPEGAERASQEQNTTAADKSQGRYVQNFGQNGSSRSQRGGPKGRGREPPRPEASRSPGAPSGGGGDGRGARENPAAADGNRPDKNGLTPTENSAAQRPRPGGRPGAPGPEAAKRARRRTPRPPEQDHHAATEREGGREQAHGPKTAGPGRPTPKAARTAHRAGGRHRGLRGGRQGRPGPGEGPYGARGPSRPDRGRRSRGRARRTRRTRRPARATYPAARARARGRGRLCAKRARRAAHRSAGRHDHGPPGGPGAHTIEGVGPRRSKGPRGEGCPLVGRVPTRRMPQ